MEIKSKPIKKCRLCFQSEFKTIIDFGNVPLGNNLHLNIKDALSAKSYPLKVIRCQCCNHFQLSYSVNPVELYATNYTYKTSIGKSFVIHLKNSAKNIINLFEKNRKFKIFDLGSNDGTALSFFKENGHSVLGIDPAKLPAMHANKLGIKTINDFFSYKLSKKIKQEYGEFDIIISHNVLAHIEDFSDIIKGIKNLLNERGKFIFEIGYFKSLIKNKIYDTIYHEHLDYHTKEPIVNYLYKNDFVVENIFENDIQGGSLRVICSKNKNNENKLKISSQINEEINFLNNQKIQEWEKNIFNQIKKISLIIKNTKDKKGRVFGYGAPTKATLVLKLIDQNKNDIEYFVEDNELKVNKYLSGSGLKILSNLPKDINVNDLVICFAWNFFNDIKNKIRDDGIKCSFLNIQSGEMVKI